MMRWGFLILVSSWCFAAAHSEVQPAAIEVPNASVWTGQRLTFFVELRAKGSFASAASFSLPKIDQTIVLKVGNPVVSSRDIEGDSWFVQKHEFALFSQRSGAVDIPAFEVRFSRREGFTGPAEDVTANVPGTTVTIRRPPGTESIGFLISCEQLEISESWEPAIANDSNETKPGAVYTRTISQQVDGMTGMALMPPPTMTPEGIRVYPSGEEINDDLNRGAFSGRRTDKIVYLMQSPGDYLLPAITYAWWNPVKEELNTKTLPAVTFTVAAPIESATSPAPEETPAKAWLALGLIVLAVAGVGFWQRHRITTVAVSVLAALKHPERVAARDLVHACRNNDVTAANESWMRWRRMQSPPWQPDEALRLAVIDLQRCLYSEDSGSDWSGQALSTAFQKRHSLHTHSHRPNQNALCELNPTHS
ncbi:MAG: hypothetical protein AAGG48_19490 [Planctomycetota bacterium]